MEKADWLKKSAGGEAAYFLRQRTPSLRFHEQSGRGHLARRPEA
jgi:hypothetical protein